MAYNRHSGRMNRAGYGRMIAQGNRERKAEQVRRQDTNRQSGSIQSAYGRVLDSYIQAMRPGKRISRTGHRYYERRENRSDKGHYL